jgi:nitrate reductase gamma subunit
MMHAALSALAVLIIALAALVAGGQPAVRPFLGAIFPAAAAVVFLAGLSWRVVVWARSPVPFRIPVTCGQQASLPWIRPARLDNPSSGLGAAGRMALEVLLFRSLLRDARAQRREDARLVFRDTIGLWIAALAFHYSLLVVAVRHLRFFLQPVPGVVTALANLDGFFQVTMPALYATDVLLVGALAWLLARRLRRADLRYLSLFADYFVLCLLLGIATTGVLMRHVVRVDVVAVKSLALGLVTLSSAQVPTSIHPLVLAHLALVSVLLAWFPFSKLMHMAGVFLSPTRNLANNSRAARHVNPWNPAVKVHTYAEWEEEFRDKLVAAGLPVEGSGNDDQ